MAIDYEKLKLIYEPAPNTREEIDAFNEQIAEITGRTPIDTGFMRVDWGMDIKKFYGGVEQVKYADPLGKYAGPRFYIAEVWNPSSVYDRIEWAQLRFEDGIDVLGPFPQKGVWDFFRFCRRDDFSMMPLGEEILNIARKWRSNSTRPHARQRAVSDYIRFNEEANERKERAFEAYREELRAEIAEELAKPELNAAFSFSEKVRNAGMDTPAGYERTNSGLIVPQTINK